MNKVRELLDNDGENRAVRSFLAAYSADRAMTVGEMRQHMDRSGWPLQYCPEFARTGSQDQEHLTKAGAQIWIRHLFSLEESNDPQPEADDEQEDDATSQWRRLALQFDAHRMQALGHLKAVLADPDKHSEQARAFLAAPPLSGETVLAQRLASLKDALQTAREAHKGCNTCRHQATSPEGACETCFDDPNKASPRLMNWEPRVVTSLKGDEA